MTKASWGEKGVYLPYKLELIVEGSQDGNSNSKPQIGSKTESMKEHHLVDYSATFLIHPKPLCLGMVLPQWGQVA